MNSLHLRARSGQSRSCRLELRPLCDGLFEEWDCLACASGLEQQRAEVERRLGIPRIELARACDAEDRLPPPSGAIEQRADVVPGHRMLGIEPQRRAIHE